MRPSGPVTAATGQGELRGDQRPRRPRHVRVAARTRARGYDVGDRGPAPVAGDGARGRADRRPGGRGPAGRRSHRARRPALLDDPAPRLGRRPGPAPAGRLDRLLRRQRRRDHRRLRPPAAEGRRPRRARAGRGPGCPGHGDGAVRRPSGPLPLPALLLLVAAVPVGKLLLADAPSAVRWVAAGPPPREPHPDPVAHHRVLATFTLAGIGLALAALAVLTPVQPGGANAPASSVVFEG